MHTEAFVIPDEPVYRSSIVLTHSVSAIQILPKENGRLTLGPLSQLPAGIILRICGDGFDDRTVQVSANGQFYFVFRQDVDRPQAFTAKAS